MRRASSASTMLAGEQHLHRRLAADTARQRHHGRGAEQADIHAGRGEARRRSRPSPDRSLPPAGSRPRWRCPAPRRSPAWAWRTICCIMAEHWVKRAAKAAAPASPSARCARHFLEVMAGGKDRAFRGDDHHPHAGIGRGALPARLDSAPIRAELSALRAVGRFEDRRSTAPARAVSSRESS